MINFVENEILKEQGGFFKGFSKGNKKILNYRNPKFNSKPIKILEAPYLIDNFYYNLLDWGFQNQIIVSLGNKIFCWNFQNQKIKMIYENTSSNVTSLQWVDFQ